MLKGFKKAAVFCLILSLLTLSFSSCKKEEKEGVLADGVYEMAVTLSGGSGRAHVTSPAKVTVENGKAMAFLQWSSRYYSYMLVDGVQYDKTNKGGNSTFEIPVVLDTDMAVSACTTAMSEPHLIDYVLHFYSKGGPEEESGSSGEAASSAGSQSSEGSQGAEGPDNTEDPKSSEGSEAAEFLSGTDIKKIGSMELSFANQFAVDYYEGGYKLITLGNGSNFLVVPEGKEKPGGLSADITCLYQPINHIYLAASSVMCFFEALDGMDHITLSGTKESDWAIEEARKRMQEGSLKYAGKYSQPDYELLLSEKCSLAIENRMIEHDLSVRDKLEELGIPVFIEQSALEDHPLGKTEWIRLYGVLLNREEEAEALFNAQKSALEALDTEDTGKTAAFFYINSAGLVVARKSSDYVPKMIELAGGSYVFKDLGDPEVRTSTVNIEMEQFFASAKDADVIFYNSNISGEISTLKELTDMNPLLKEFKAVKTGNVWVTGKNLYQDSLGLGDMIGSFRQIFTGEADGKDELMHLKRLK